MSAMRHERDTSKERNKESLLIHCTQLAPADSRRMLTTWSAMFVDHNSFLVLEANFVHTSMSNISEHGNANTAMLNHKPRNRHLNRAHTLRA